MFPLVSCPYLPCPVSTAAHKKYGSSPQDKTLEGLLILLSLEKKRKKNTVYLTSWPENTRDWARGGVYKPEHKPKALDWECVPLKRTAKDFQIITLDINPTPGPHILTDIINCAAVGLFMIVEQ